MEQLAQIQHLRDSGGTCWTGWKFTNQARFPAEQSSWTAAAAAVVIGAEALSGATCGSGAFRDVAAPPGVTAPADSVACGCGPRVRSADAGGGPAPAPVANRLPVPPRTPGAEPFR